MRSLIILITFFTIVSCKTQDTKVQSSPNEEKSISSPEFSFSLNRLRGYTLVKPIPEDDQWLLSYRKGHNYREGWETWIWRKTDIDLGNGITVFAREDREKQFLVSGVPELDKITIDFRDEPSVGKGWSFGGMHIGSLSPSGNYIVVLTDHPQSFLATGMSLKERYKTDYGWDFSFNDEVVTWWKRVKKN